MRSSVHKFSQKLAGEAGLRLLSSVFVLLLARILGAERFGQYTSAMAYAALCIILVDLGTNPILTREMARHPEDRLHIAQSSHLLKVVASFGAWAVLAGLLLLFPLASEDRRLILCIGWVVIGFTLSEYFCALLSGMNEMGWEAILKVTSRATALSFGFVALGMRQPLLRVAGFLALGALASYGVSVKIVAHRLGRFGLLWDPTYLRRLLISSLPVFGSVILWVLYDTQDILVLNALHFSKRDIGLFASAIKVMDILRVFPVLAVGAVFPSLAQLHEVDIDAFARKKRKLFMALGGSLLFLTAATYLGSSPIIRILYKASYSPAAQLLKFLAPSLVLVGLNHAQMQFLIAQNLERQLVISAILVTVSNLILALVLLPRVGLPGACFALFGGELLNFIYLLRTNRRPKEMTWIVP